MEIYTRTQKEQERVDEAMRFEKKASAELAKHNQNERLVSSVPGWLLAVQSYLGEAKKSQDLIDFASPKLPEWDVAEQRVINEITRILELPEKIRGSLIVLANNGWYFDFDLLTSDLFEIANAFAENDIENVEAALADYFHSHRIKIREFLINQFPNRRHIFEAAFEAHEHEKYVLSIPVLMTQIDGMCKDKTDASFFIGGNQKKLSKSLAEIVAESYLGLFVAPVEEKTSVRMSFDDREKFLEENLQKEFKEVNRHLVLHGECVDYDTYINSIKMISLAYYLARILTCTPT